MTVGLPEATAREKMCSRSSAGRARRVDLGGFVEKRSMVLRSDFFLMESERPARDFLHLIWFR